MPLNIYVMPESGVYNNDQYCVCFLSCVFSFIWVNTLYFTWVSGLEQLTFPSWFSSSHSLWNTGQRCGCHLGSACQKQLFCCTWQVNMCKGRTGLVTRLLMTAVRRVNTKRIIHHHWQHARKHLTVWNQVKERYCVYMCNAFITLNIQFICSWWPQFDLDFKCNIN